VTGRKPQWVTAEQWESGSTPSRNQRRKDSVDMREFIAWDGEGGETDEIVTVIEREGFPPQPIYRQNYILFGCSDGPYVSGEKLGASECLDLLLDVERANPDAIHVIFSGGYDVVKILEEWPAEILDKIYQGKWVEYDGYRIEYRAGKSFRVSSGDCSLTLFDVFSFFGTSFVSSIRQYLGDVPELANIVKGKEARGSFTLERMESEVLPYWRGELILLVKLCETLRGHFHRIGVRGNQWHGPGAIANVLNKTYGIKRFLSDYERDTDFQYALQCSYAGGRFELFRVGYHGSATWQYDRNSAYPYAATFLPDLSGGVWTHRGGPVDIDSVQDFGMYRVSMDLGMSMWNDQFHRMPGPLFWRSKQSLIYYPHAIASGWYRGVEVKNLSYFESELYTIHEGYEFTPASPAKPYGWIDGMYQRRLEYKREGNPTEYAVKIALNSIYGKMVQHTGYDPATGDIPRWHQLEWGSYVTAHCRAAIFQALFSAYMEDPSSIIACETDAIFTTRPVTLPLSEELGDWKPTNYKSILYLQNGMYFTDGVESGKAKTRGIEAGSITFEDAMDYLKRYSGRGELDSGGLHGSSHRFGSMGQHRGKLTLGQWFDQPREISIASQGHEKRYHDPEACDRCPKNFTRGTHSLVPGIPPDVPSFPYVLPWNELGSENPFRTERETRFEQPPMFE